jgi:DNA-binding CsgD family transcriptional regulator
MRQLQLRLRRFVSAPPTDAAAADPPPGDAVPSSPTGQLEAGAGWSTCCGHGDIPMAVEAVRNGARDFIEKPFDARWLIDTVLRALEDVPALARQRDERSRLRRRLETLSARELEVLALVVEGHQTKVIAYRLGISPRTAETHRARVMEKMGARFLSELIRQSLVLERPPTRPWVASVTGFDRNRTRGGT